MFDIFRTYSYINVYAHVCHKLYYNASFFRCEIRPCYNMLLVYIISGLWHVIFLTFTHGNEMETSHKKRTLKVSNFLLNFINLVSLSLKKTSLLLTHAIYFFLFPSQPTPKRSNHIKNDCVSNGILSLLLLLLLFMCERILYGSLVTIWIGSKKFLFFGKKMFSYFFFYKNQVKTSLLIELLIIIITCDTNTTSK